jgi:hypothetical protein
MVDVEPQGPLKIAISFDLNIGDVPEILPLSNVLLEQDVEAGFRAPRERLERL